MASVSFEHADEARSALHAILGDLDYRSDQLPDATLMSNLLEDLLPGAPRAHRVPAIRPSNRGEEHDGVSGPSPRLPRN